MIDPQSWVGQIFSGVKFMFLESLKNYILKIFKAAIMVERQRSEIIDILEMDTDILTEEEMDDYYQNLMSSGDTIHKATEQLCFNDLKQSIGELLRYFHLCEQECIFIQKDLEKALRDLTLESREKVKNTIKAAVARKSYTFETPYKLYFFCKKVKTTIKEAAAKKSYTSETPDELLKVGVESYRKDFRELISLLPNIREKCHLFYKDLKKVSADIRQQNAPTRLQQANRRLGLNKNVEQESPGPTESI